MNRQCLMTVVSADHYQHYIPMFIMAARQWAERSSIDIRIYLRGEIDPVTDECVAILEQYGHFSLEHDAIFENQFPGYPEAVSATNTLRFLHDDDVLSQYEQVMILDVDLLLFANVFGWHLAECRGQPFAGHHGPYHKPHRPEIAQEWKGQWERVAGGFFMVTRGWWDRTRASRESYSEGLMHGHVGRFRESDEVTLARIIKGSGMEVPASKYFPPELRGIHLGDFRENMRHRWTNLSKMLQKLTTDNCWAFMQLERQPAWVDMMEVLEKDSAITQTVKNVRLHLEERGVL